MMHAGAFNWTFTLGTGLLDPWTIGATALIPAPGTGVAALPLLMKRHDASIFAAAPGIYRQLLKSPLPALPKLRHGLAAGEKMPETLRQSWREATGTEVHEAFGMSECSTFISGSPAHPAPPHAIGYPQEGRRVSLRLDGPVCPAEAPGVIAVHRDDPGLMLGYLDAPEETAARFDGDWFLTGDMGRLAPDGAILYDGRNDDMMNAGGFRVSPLEVEAAMQTHPAIAEAAACELRVKADASVIALFYTGMPAADAALADHAAAHLARYKAPRLFVHVGALPRGANNKLLRRKLRTEWEADHGQT
ncbi:Benzoate--CoA ligase [Roseisalinus antarcticus]|uniref:Benzoate--CoA ligase n=1 Tax=Roseisalinus antarcticus TaxID=254357 RepID=A0A1Y5TBL9_9RHOB|nr:Benzoate--CoA ligase [Roseisalinus antarcticus]